MDMLSTVQRGHPLVRGVYYAVLPLSLISLAGLWRWKRWAIWMTLLLSAIRIPSEALLGLPLVHVIRVPVVLAILMLLVWRHRRRFT